MFFHLVTSMKQRTNSESQWGIKPQCLKTYHLPYSIYKHEAINIADPGCIQDVCHVISHGECFFFISLLLNLSFSSF